MYQYHKDSIDNLARYMSDNDRIIAAILGGSIAKGCEREDSDIDAIIVVTDDLYNELSAECRLSETIFGHCTYEKGYFDIKYVNKGYLRDVAERGSEPARISFEKSRCIFTKDPEIEEFIRRIPVFQKHEKDAKLLAFYSAMDLNAGYFWRISEDNKFLRARAVTDIVLFGLRLVIQDKEILFPCNRGLYRAVSGIGEESVELLKLSDALLSLRDTASKEAFVSKVMSIVEYQPPKNYSEMLTSYINNHELWWYKRSPVIAEW